MLHRITLLSFGILFVTVIWPTGTRCYKQQYDVGFLVDRSRSMGSDHIQNIEAFIESFLQRFSISPSNSRFAVISFASHPTLEHRFTDTINREKLLRAVKGIRYAAGSTNAIKAFTAMYHLFVKESRKKAKKILFIFTDGRIKKEKMPRSILRYIRHYGIVSVLFGVGQRLLRPGLNYIAQGLHSFHWLYLHPSNNYERVVDKLIHSKVKLTECSGDGYVRDECDRLCTCVDGRKTNCYRVRKEFNEMTYNERVRFITTFKVLSNSKKFKRRYDALVKIHMNGFCNGIHNGDQFFPWHRWYIWKYENMLREVDCRVTVPYWDWAYWSKEAWSLKYIWRSTRDGLGGNGNTNDSFCVDTGPFTRSKWKLPSYYKANEIAHRIELCTNKTAKQKNHPNETSCLRRKFHGTPPNSVNILRLLHLKPENYSGFVRQVSDTYHNDTHNFIGGDMCTKWASYDPIFFMHHAMLDKIWYLWQSISPFHLKRSKQSNIQLLGNPFRSWAFVDPHNQPDDVKVTYSSFGQLHRKREIYDDKALKNEPGSVSNATKNETCQAYFLATQQELKLVKSFIDQANFTYDPDLFSHLDKFNLENSWY